MQDTCLCVSLRTRSESLQSPPSAATDILFPLFCGRLVSEAAVKEGGRGRRGGGLWETESVFVAFPASVREKRLGSGTAEM